MSELDQSEHEAVCITGDDYECQLFDYEPCQRLAS